MFSLKTKQKSRSVFKRRRIGKCNKNMPKMECKRKLKVNQNKTRQKSHSDMP